MPFLSSYNVSNFCILYFVHRLPKNFKNTIPQLYIIFDKYPIMFMGKGGGISQPPFMLPVIYTCIHKPV